jgi:hypothetical protein
MPKGTATNFTGAVGFTSSDAKAVLPRAFQFTAANGGVKVFNVTLKTAGTQSIGVHSGLVTGNDSVDVVAAAVNHLGVSAIPSATAGTPFDVTVSALDLYGNVVTGYLGTVKFTSSATPLADLPPDYTFQAADNGVKTFAVTLKKSGLQTVTVTDSVKPTLKKGVNVTVAADVLSGFRVSGYPVSTHVNAPHPFTVTAVDQFGNTITNYLGPVVFSSSDGEATLPNPYTFKAVDKGHHTFFATLRILGTQTLTVTDQNNALITGTESGINVI